MAVVNNLKTIRESRGLLQVDICNRPYLRDYMHTPCSIIKILQGGFSIYLQQAASQ